MYRRFFYKNIFSGFTPMDFVASLRGTIALSSQANFGGWGSGKSQKKEMRDQQQIITRRCVKSLSDHC
jgi:hypothetical protein